jgi:hypothetical protein
MVEVKKFMPPDVVDRDELLAWRAGIKKEVAENCPDEVRQFIEALAAKLPDFGQIGKFHSSMSGKDLLLSGMKEFNGERIDPWTLYHLPVPRMVAMDHEKNMHRIFRRQGKQGLINYCKANVKGTELQKVLDVLNVHVFKQERAEFLKVMSEINHSKQLDAKLDIE